MIRERAAKTAEATVKQVLGVQHWVSRPKLGGLMTLLESRPTITSKDLVAGTRDRAVRQCYRKGGRQDRQRLVPDYDRGRTLSPSCRRTLRQTRVCRHRSQYERRLRSHSNRSRSKLFRPTRKLTASSDWIRCYGRRSAGSWPGYVFTTRREITGRAFRIGSWHRGARSG